MESTDDGLYITFTYKNELYIYDGNSMNKINTCSPEGFVSALATIQGNLYAVVWECENKIYKIDKDTWIPIANMEENPRDMVSYNNKLIVRGSYALYEYQKTFKHLFFDRDLFFTKFIVVFNNELIIHYKNNFLIYDGHTFKIDKYFNKKPQALIVYKEDLYFPTFFGEFYVYEP
jgi:hypothetical protein